MSGCKIFTQKKEIMAYLGTTREYVADSMVQFGMPVVFVNGRWWSSSDAIDKWLVEFFMQHRGRRIDAKSGACIPSDIAAALMESGGENEP